MLNFSIGRFVEADQNTLTWTQIGDTWRATNGGHTYVITDLGTDFRVVRKGSHNTRVPTLDSAKKLAKAWERGVIRPPGAR